MIEFGVDHLREEKTEFFAKSIRGNILLSFMPVVFTTAKLWTCEYDISTADLETGKVDLEGADLREEKWLFYQYAQSPDLKHSHSAAEHISNISDVLYIDYTRTIPIVNALSIGEFLSNKY
jgi:hypothetical protein